MIVGGWCTSFLAEALAGGVHTRDDTYKLALFTESATLDSDTRTYKTDNEAVGRGYTAGGIALTGQKVGITGKVAWMSFDSPVWPETTITARGALIYNSSKSNRAVGVVAFVDEAGRPMNVTSTNGPYTVELSPMGIQHG